MRPRAIAAFLAMSVCAAGAGDSVESLVASVRAALASRKSDKDVAKLIHKAQLAQRLDDVAIEALESEGAGPKTLEELERQRELSRRLPAPLSSPVFVAAPPAPAFEEWRAALNHAGSVALNYTRSLPDFICTQTVQRFKDTKLRGSWDLVDTLTLRLAYSVGHAEDYKLVAINGRPTFREYEEVGGALSKGEFASILHQVFAASAHAQFRWERWTTIRRRPAHVYSFVIQPEHSSYVMDTNLGYQRYRTVLGQHGLIYVDRDSGQVVRIISEADHFPADFPVQKARSTLDYDFIDVGGKAFLLPLRAEVHMSVPRQFETRNLVEFHNYRKFSSEATITFEK